MYRKAKIMVVAAAVGAVGLLGAGIAQAGGVGDDADTPITGAALERAGAAALEHTGGGTVTETEVGDEDSRYEVEVERPDGTSVDVQLDARFRVVGDAVDHEDGSGR